MKPSDALNKYRDDIKSIVMAHRVSNIRVFGSAIHGDDTDDSDLDLLVDPTSDTTLMDIGSMRYKLRELLGIPVDIVTPKSLPASFREQVIKEAKPL